MVEIQPKGNFQQFFAAYVLASILAAVFPICGNMMSMFAFFSRRTYKVAKARTHTHTHWLYRFSYFTYEWSDSRAHRKDWYFISICCHTTLRIQFGFVFYFGCERKCSDDFIIIPNTAFLLLIRFFLFIVSNIFVVAGKFGVFCSCTSIIVYHAVHLMGNLSGESGFLHSLCSLSHWS